MNRYHKLASLFLAAAVCLSVSCKKNTSIDKTDNTAAVSKQLALDLYRSLANNISVVNNNGVKTGSTSHLVTMDTHSCGQSVTSITNKTETKGDTTRSYTGNSVFTYMCNGFLSNGVDLDAYTQKDSLAVAETGTGFKNNYQTSFTYDVRALDNTYQNLKVNGSSRTYSYNSKVSGSKVTSAYTVTTLYSWANVIADTSGPRNAFISGSVDYNTQILDNTDGSGGQTYKYHGSLQFLPGFKMNVIFRFEDNSTKVYLVNILTGETTRTY